MVKVTELKAVVGFQLLVLAAKSKVTLSYGQVSDTLGGGNRFVGVVNSHLKKACEKFKCPDISGIVVNKYSKLKRESCAANDPSIAEVFAFDWNEETTGKIISFLIDEAMRCNNPDLYHRLAKSAKALEAFKALEAEEASKEMARVRKCDAKKVEYFNLYFPGDSVVPVAILCETEKRTWINVEIICDDGVYSYSFDPTNDPTVWRGACSNSCSKTKATLYKHETSWRIVSASNNVWQSEDYSYEVRPATREEFFTWRDQLKELRDE